MKQVAIAALLVLFAGLGDLHAEVIKGKVKKVDAAKGILTVAVKDKDRDFKVTADTKITIQVAAGNVIPKDGLKNIWFTNAAKAKDGYQVEVTVETKDKKEVVTKIHLFTPTRRE